MVESGGLENRCAFTGTVGSNPTLSAIRDLGLERRLVHAIVGALTQHERLEHRPQGVWL